MDVLSLALLVLLLLALILCIMLLAHRRKLKTTPWMTPGWNDPFKHKPGE